MNPIQFSKDFACTHREYLPCKFAYSDGDIYRCSYHRLLVLVSEDEGDKLTEQACPPIREEDAFQRYLGKLFIRNAMDIIENANIGDPIFCSVDFSGDGEVILLSKPKNYTGHCTYKNKKDEIRECQVGHCRTISKGNFSVEHLIEGKDSEIESQMIRWKAVQAGFRVEIENVKEGFLVKIFGDSQKEVDDFMSLCVYHNFTLI